MLRVERLSKLNLIEKVWTNLNTWWRCKISNLSKFTKIRRRKFEEISVEFWKRQNWTQDKHTKKYFIKIILKTLLKIMPKR